MKPAPYNLPPIYRGCIYPQIVFTWLGQDGNPVDLTGWLASAASQNIIFTLSIPDPQAGVVGLSLSSAASANLALGIEPWDWRWTFNELVWPPSLAGFVEIKESQSPAP